MVSRNGGDAGTAIHTSVPFENPANMTLAFPVDRFGRRRLEVAPAPAKGCRASCPAPSREEEAITLLRCVHS
jgi:hypothetical protein